MHEVEGFVQQGVSFKAVSAEEGTDFCRQQAATGKDSPPRSNP